MLLNPLVFGRNETGWLMGNKYKTPRDRKISLEAKLKTRAKELGRRIERERQIFIFDRFLKRLSLNFPGR